MDKANINEPLDLQDATRRDDIYTQLNEIVDKLQSIHVYPSLLWVWAFDILRDTYENNLTAEDWTEEIIRDGVTLKQIFDKFWEDVDNLGLSMDSGGDIIEEVIMDWMRENEFLVSFDEEDWND